MDFATYDHGADVATLRVGARRSLPTGSYALIACASAALADMQGNPLDGNGDGVGGDDFVRRFRILTTNLLVNPNFDDMVSDWLLTGTDVGLTHGLADAEQAGHSGAALVSGQAGQDVGFALWQCVDVAGIDGAFSFDALALVSGAGQDSVEVWAEISFHDQPDCVGESFETFASDLLEADGSAEHQVVSMSVVRSSQPALSAKVALVGSAGALPSAEFEVSFDTLSFSHGAVVWADSFDEPGLGGWD